MKTIIIIVLGAVLAGCATNHPSMRRNEFISTTQRAYQGVDEQEFYAAAERLFRLSDEGDTAFAFPGEHVMLVERDWSAYLVLVYAAGTHHWKLETEPTAEGLIARVYASMASSSVTGSPTGGGGASTITSSMAGSMVNTPALYGLFWARMDYLLGKSRYWPSCSDWKAEVRSGKTYGNIEPLCLKMNTDDYSPSSLSD